MNDFTFGSVCSGIEAASVAWHPLGWRAGFVSEIDRHASAVLRHRFPAVPNHGDFTTITQDHDGTAIDLLVGGTPCQAFSVAGLRKGLADDRGQLTLEFLRLADRLGPEWLVWENVPGVLSQDDGRAFGALLGGMAELGYGFAYRVLDAQNYGVPQRRRRVFVVGCLGDWRRAAAVLFERESLSGHLAPSRKAGEGVAGSLKASSGRRRMAGVDEGAAGHLLPHVAPTLEARGVGTGQELSRPGGMVINAPEAYQCHGGSVGPMGTLRTNASATGGVPFVMATGQGAAEIVRDGCPSLTCNHEAPISFQVKDDGGQTDTDLSPTLLNQHTSVGIAYGREYQGDRVIPEDGVWPTLPATAANNGGGAGARLHRPHEMQVRRLTPTECERLQGFPDGWTATGDYGKGPEDVSDTQRYKMCGNSMAVPVMRWIGERINLVRSLTES